MLVTPNDVDLENAELPDGADKLIGVERLRGVKRIE